VHFVLLIALNSDSSAESLQQTRVITLTLAGIRTIWPSPYRTEGS